MAAAIPDWDKTGAQCATAAESLAGSSLRREAETALRTRTAPPVPGPCAASPETSAQTLHELHVHQIELEMQNEELRRRQAELSAAHRRYFDLYDLAPVGYCSVSEAGVILQANLTLSTLLGLERSALVQQSFSRFIYRDDMDIYYLMGKALLKSGQAQTAELRMQKKDGTQFWAQLVSNVSQGADGSLRLVLTDISQHKALALELAQHRLELEQRVKSRTEQFLDLYDQAPCGYHSLSAEGVILLANKTELALLGYTQAEYVDHRMVEFLTPHSVQLFNDIFPRLLESGRIRNIELDFYCKDGSVRCFSMDADVATDSVSEVLLIRSTMVDISERKRHEQRLEMALLGADLGLWDLQIPSGELHLSERACQILGQAQSGIFSHMGDLEALVHPDDAPPRRAAINAYLEGDLPYLRIEYRLRHRDGHWVWVRSQGKVVARDEKAAAVRAVGTLQDISQEKLLKQEGAELLQRIEALMQNLGKAPQTPPQSVPFTPCTPVLGAREQQVIQLIAAGCTSAEIGEHLGISTSTAATHRRNLMRKLDLHSAAELTRYAVAHKLINS